MAFLGSNMANEVGLRLLFCPLGSNIVIRTACCSVGVGLPIYSTFKAIERKDEHEQKKWLIYWTGWTSTLWVIQPCRSVFRQDSLLLNSLVVTLVQARVPFYYHLKFAFLVWLQLPLADGARQLYNNHLRPFFTRHQASVDQFTGLAYSEMVKLIYSYQAKVQFAKAAIKKISGSVNHMLKGPGGSDQQQGGNSTNPQIRTIFDIESDTED